MAGNGFFSGSVSLFLLLNIQVMASKRKFKKQLNKVIFDVVEECFVVQIHEPEKAEATNKLVSEVVSFRNDMRHKISSTKHRKDFTPVRTEAQQTINGFVERVNAL